MEATKQRPIQSMEEARHWERLFIGEIQAGRDPRRPRTRRTTTTNAAPRSVADFIDAYMTPVDIRARINRLARQHRDLVEVIALPNRTQGYRRTATAFLGNPAVAAIVVESVKFGDQNVNGTQVRTVDPGAPNRPLTARFRDRVLTVSLATDAAGKTVSTTDEVAALITARFPNRFSAFVEDGSAERHVGSDDIANAGSQLWQSRVRTSDDPVELGRERSWPALGPGGLDRAADAENVGVLVMHCQALEPVALGDGVVVQKGNDISACCSQPRVPRA